MKVRLSAMAESDLEDIGDFIAQDDPRRAISFIRELHATCLHLVDAPEGYPLAWGFEHLGIRMRVHRAYLIFYRVSGARIEVIRILHGRRNVAAILTGMS